MEELTFLRDLAVVMMAATAMALLLTRFRLPAVLGYLAAGILIGPHTAPARLITDPAHVELLAELGLVFLLFALGLEFHLGKLKRVGGGVLVAGALAVLGALALGFFAARGLGWAVPDAVFAATIVAFSSTTVVVKLLEAQGRLDGETGRFVIALLLVEDLAAVALITFLSGFAGGGVSLADVSLAVGRITLFVIVALVLGVLLVPRLVDHVARLERQELLVVTTLGVAFTMTMLAGALGFSAALGAFIAGALIADARASLRVERLAAPLRDAFTAVFFVAVGMLVDPSVLVGEVGAVLALTAVVVLGRPVVIALASVIGGLPPRRAVAAGLAMPATSEFAFVLAGVGIASGVVQVPLLDIAAAVAVATAIAASLISPYSERIADGATNLIPRRVVGGLDAYARALARRRARSGRRNPYSGGGSLVRFAGAYAVLVALSYSSAVASHAVAEAAGPDGVLVRGDAVLLVWAVAGLLGLAVAGSAIRAMSGLVDGLAALVAPGDVWSRAIANGTWLLIGLAFGGFLVAVTIPDLPPLRDLAIAGGIVAAVGIPLARRVRALETRIARAVEVVFIERPSGGSAEGVEALVADHLPADAAVEEVEIPEGARAAARRLRDLPLSRGGATVVALRREGGSVLNPGPDEPLLPGDHVVLLGTARGLERAREALTERAPPSAHEEPELAFVEYRLHEGDALVGRTLRDAHLREATGATVIGVRRYGHPILNPPADLRLHAGDVLLILGSRQQVLAAVLYAPPADPVSPTPATGIALSKPTDNPDATPIDARSGSAAAVRERHGQAVDH